MTHRLGCRCSDPAFPSCKALAVITRARAVVRSFEPSPWGLTRDEAMRAAFVRAARPIRNKGTITVHKPVTPLRVSKKGGE